MPPPLKRRIVSKNKKCHQQETSKATIAHNKNRPMPPPYLFQTLVQQVLFLLGFVPIRVHHPTPSSFAPHLRQQQGGGGGFGGNKSGNRFVSALQIGKRHDWSDGEKRGVPFNCSSCWRVRWRRFMSWLAKKVRTVRWMISHPMMRCSSRDCVEVLLVSNRRRWSSFWVIMVINVFTANNFSAVNNKHGEKIIIGKK